MQVPSDIPEPFHDVARERESQQMLLEDRGRGVL